MSIRGKTVETIVEVGEAKTLDAEGEGAFRVVGGGNRNGYRATGLTATNT